MNILSIYEPINLNVFQEASIDSDRIEKQIKDKELVDSIIHIDEKDVTRTFLMELFGTFNGKRKADPYDIIEIPAGSYGPEGNKNKNKFITTVGIWIFNKYFIENDFFHIFKYMNKNINAGSFKGINQDLSYALMEDKITLDQLKRYLLKTQFIMGFSTILCPNYTEKLMSCTKVINKKKSELYKKYKKEIDAGDPIAAENMRKELLTFAVDYMGDDPAMDSFLSGARGSVSNNFGNMFVMKGAIRNPDPNALKEFDIALSNYMDGVTEGEYSIFCTSLSAGPYSRGKKTAIGGYWEKLIGSAFQHLKLDPEGSDCGTKRFVKFSITDKNKKLVMYNYIIEGTKLVELTSDNIDRYVGKTVKMRFSSMCESKTGFCNKCAGNMYYRQGIVNVGTTLPQIGSTLKNKAMKAFHDSTVNTAEMNVMKAFGLE